MNSIDYTRPKMGAPVWFFPCVDVGVRPQVASLCECRVTPVCAFIRLLCRTKKQPAGRTNTPIQGKPLQVHPILHDPGCSLAKCTHLSLSLSVCVCLSVSLTRLSFLSLSPWVSRERLERGREMFVCARDIDERDRRKHEKTCKRNRRKKNVFFFLSFFLNKKVHD